MKKLLFISLLFLVGFSINGNAQPGPKIDTLIISPSNPINTDSVLLIVRVAFGTLGTGILNETISFNSFDIDIEGCYFSDGATQPRLEIDTLKLGLLNSGLYTLNFVAKETYGILDLFCDTFVYSDTSAINFMVGPISIDDNVAESGLNLFPNPISSTFTIKGNYELPAVVELYDITGRQVYRQALTSNRQQVDISPLSKGIYLWKLSSKLEGTTFGKLVKQ